MTLEIIQKDTIAAMKSHNAIIVETLRGITAAIKKAAIDKRIEIDEKLVDEVLLKEKKIIQEMIDTCPKERQDLMDKYNLKMEIINEYAPKLETNPAVIKCYIVYHLTEAGVDAKTANKGQIMKTVMPVLKGKVDMAVANKVIADLIK